MDTMPILVLGFFWVGGWVVGWGVGEGNIFDQWVFFSLLKK